jgi:uncharacterized protein
LIQIAIKLKVFTEKNAKIMNLQHFLNDNGWRKLWRSALLTIISTWMNRSSSKLQSSNPLKTQLVKLGFSLGGIYLLACILLFWQQRRFIFVPSRTMEQTPADYQLPYEDVELSIFTAHSFENRREMIHGWWIPAQNPNAKTLLYLHGNGLNIGANAEQASRFHKLGLSVFLFDYCGYGKSSGDFPSEASVYSDAQRAWDYLTQTRKISPNQIVIYGHSLGGAIAINLATQHSDAAGLIVQSSFTSAVEMASRNWWTVLFPIHLLLTQRFDSIDRVPQLHLPTLYIHGTDDDRIPFEMSQRLFQATRSPKQLKLFPGAGHNNVAQVGGAVYSQLVQDFVIQADEAAAR